VARLFILVEGETEETFVNELLAPHLYGKGFESVSARLMGNARLRAQRGGVLGWTEVKTEIVRHLRTNAALFVTTMVDYYGMPSDPKNAENRGGVICLNDTQLLGYMLVCAPLSGSVAEGSV